MGEITKDELRERLGNIDQIRDIIFGAHLREYNSRLDKAEADIAAMQQDVRDRLTDLKNTFTLELRTAVESIDKRLRNIATATQEETSDLRQQFDRVSRKFTNNFEILDEAIESQRVALRDELAQTRDNLQNDNRELRSLVLEELERHFSILRDDKVSKDDMAELLFELGMRLKGSEFVPELRQVVEDKVEEKYEQVLIAPEPEVKPAPARATTTPTETTSTTTKAGSRTKRLQ